MATIDGSVVPGYLLIIPDQYYQFYLTEKEAQEGAKMISAANAGKPLYVVPCSYVAGYYEKEGTTRPKEGV